MQAYEALTDEVVREYGDRKKPGRVSLVVDTLTSDIYLVPKNVEHIDFMKGNFSNRDYGLFVPFHLDMDNEDVVKLTPGESGLEYKLGVEHDNASIAIARVLVFEFIRKGDKRCRLNK